MKNLITKMTTAVILFGSITANAQDGTLDPSFDIGGGAFTYTNNSGITSEGSIRAIALYPDGKILAGGQFNKFNGTVKNAIVRLNADGSFDNSFDTGTGPSNGNNVVSINMLALMPDGKILTSGSFLGYYNGVAISGELCRLNSDGSLDGSFTWGGNGRASQITVLPDGKILIAGVFSQYNGDVSRKYIIRLNADYSIDNTFNTEGTGLNGGVQCFVVQPDGKIVIAGQFTYYNGIANPRHKIARLNEDGSLDTSFNPGTGVRNTDENYSSSQINDIKLQQDGKILIAGWYRWYNDVQQRGFSRINTDGSLDTIFGANAVSANTGTFNGGINSIIIQPDGKVLIGGAINTSSYGGSTQIRHLCRLNTDASVDASFNVGSGFIPSGMNTMLMQPDGKIIAGGQFTKYNGIDRKGIARINNSLDSVATGINDISVNAINIYPNPAKNTVTVNNIEKGSMLSITDVTGQVLYTGKVNRETVTLNITEFGAGVYFVKVESGNTVVTEKLIIQ